MDADVDEVLGVLREVAGGIDVEVVRPELLTFEDEAKLLADAGVVVFVHGAFQANLVFLPEGAAVVELKQYGEYSTQPRDLCAALLEGAWDLS